MLNLSTYTHAQPHYSHNLTMSNYLPTDQLEKRKFNEALKVLKQFGMKSLILDKQEDYAYDIVDLTDNSKEPLLK